MLTGANQAIIEMYETLGMSPDQIAEAEDYDIVAVKSVLMQFSAKYRTDIRIEPELGFSVDEQLEAKNAMVRLMRTSEDEQLVARLAMRIRDDAKGRLDPVKQQNGLNVNITIFNQRLLEARAAKDKSKALPKPAPELIDVESEKVIA